jgi:uncharacterized protein (TIGR03067 family)
VNSIVLSLRLATWLCLAFVFTHGAGAAPDPEPPLTNAEALKKMQGTWQIVSVENDGVPLPAKEDASQVVVEKKSFVIKGVSRREPYIIRLDASAKTPRIDMTFDGPKSFPGLGIFKFEADKLIIVNAEPGKSRPTKFDSKTGTKFVLRRPKAGK